VLKDAERRFKGPALKKPKQTVASRKEALCQRGKQQQNTLVLLKARPPLSPGSSFTSISISLGITLSKDTNWIIGGPTGKVLPLDLGTTIDSPVKRPGIARPS
jgi:hypothetical protein